MADTAELETKLAGMAVEEPVKGTNAAEGDHVNKAGIAGDEEPDKTLEVEKEEIKRARNAVKKYFDEAYGTDVSRLDRWQKLCGDVGATVGPSIKQCKKNLKGVYINIVDFVADKNVGKKIRTFKSATALRKYIEDNPTKTYPKKAAKGNLILTWMLIRVYY